MRVHTVTGPIAPEELGTCLMHVHLLGGPDEAPEVPDLHLPDADAARRELEAVRAAGGASVMEMGCWDFGRSLDDLASLATQTGVAIVAVAGFRSGATAGAQIADVNAPAIAERLCRDLGGGPDPSSPRSGAIKAGSGRGALSDADKKILTAAAIAHVRTGAAVLTHTDHGELALDQVRMLEDGGVDPRRMAIGHLDRAGLDAQLAVLATGANIVLDQIGKDKYLSTEEYHRLIEGLLAAGHQDRIMLSSDFGRRSYLRSYGGEPGLDFLLREFVDDLVGRGVPETSLRRMLVDNPAGVLAYDCATTCCASVKEQVDVHA